MRILYLGDIVGENTLKVLSQNLESIKKQYKINMILCNGENVTKGRGLSLAHYKELKSMGIAGITMGNHTFSKSEIKDYIDEATIARPANYNCTIGKDVLYIKYNNETIALINLLGRVYLNMSLDCPFKVLEKLLSEIKADHIIVDFHGEATSEKKAFMYNFASRVDAILGTHTHVQTNDAMVYNNTCYITDLGMCGPKDSVIGDDKEAIIERFKTGIYCPANIAKCNTYIINGAIIDLGKENKIETFNLEVKA